MKARWQSFDPIEVGLAVKEVAAELIYANQNARDKVRWFHGANDVDLFIWSNDNRKVIKQQLTFFGMVLEWNVIEGLKTGQIDPDSRTGNHRGGPNPSELIKFDSKPVFEVVERGRLLLAQIISLESALGRSMDENFSDTRSGTIMPAEELIRRWGGR